MHTLPPALLQRPVRVLVVGCGGNGSAIASGLPYLHQAMLVHGHPGGLDVTVMDGDLISETNCVRQPFSRHEIGLPKVTVLVSRLNLFFGLNWKALPEYFSDRADPGPVDLLIGCVDTRAARSTINRWVTDRRRMVCYWLDLGNGASTGQFVLGQPLNASNRRRATRLRTVVELFPEIADPTRDNPEEPTCSAFEVLRRQGPFTNTALAALGLSCLAQLLVSSDLACAGAFMNIADQFVRPLPLGVRKRRR